MWSPFNSLLDQLLAGDVCGLLLPLMLLLAVGQHTIRGHRQLTRLSYLLGWLTFLLFAVASTLVQPVVSGGELLVILISGLVFAGYVVSIAWLLLPLVALVWGVTITTPLRGLQTVTRRWQTAWQSWRARQRHHRQERHRRRQEARTRPQREEAAHKEQRRQRTQQRRQQKKQAERDQRRYGLQLLYDRHRVELAEKLPPAQFASYFEQFLSDSLSPDKYAERTKLLEQMIHERLGISGNQPDIQFGSVEEVVAFFEERKRRLRGLDVDPDTLETVALDIEEEQRQAIHEFLKRHLAEP